MKQFSNNKGVSLIIVVFAMMLLAVLGWSLAILQSTDFEMSIRQLDSERALHVAEAGAQWAMNQLSQNANWRTDDSSDGGDGENHIFSSGEYNVLCRDPVGTEVGNAVIISTGYVPPRPDYRAMRQVEIHTDEGAFVNAISGAQKFDWDGTGGYEVIVNGNIISLGFEGDDADREVYDEEGPGLDQSDDDLEVPGDGERIVGPILLPEIDMEYFRDYAVNVLGQVFEEIVGDSVRLDNRNYNNRGVLYVEDDVIIDLEDHDINFRQTSVIAEGNIQIIGTNKLAMLTHVYQATGETFPCLATRDGNITSTDVPLPDKSEQSRKKARDFSGLIYTQNGNAQFNYITGVSIMGQEVILSGSIELNYEAESRYLDTIGYIEGAAGVVNWRER